MRPVFFIYSIMILRNIHSPPYYYVFTNAGLSIYTDYQQLPDLCKTFIAVHITNALSIPSTPPIAIIPLHKYI